MSCMMVSAIDLPCEWWTGWRWKPRIASTHSTAAFLIASVIAGRRTRIGEPPAMRRSRMRSAIASTRPRPTSRRNTGGYSQTSVHASRRSALAAPLVARSPLPRDRSADVRLRSRTAQQPVRARDRHQAPQPVSFAAGDATPHRGQPVVLPPLVVEIDRRPARRFGDPAVLQHSVQRAIQRARLQLDLAVGQPGDFLEDGVAVTLFASESEQHVELDGPQ